MAGQPEQPRQLMMLRRAAPVPEAKLPEGWAIRPMEQGEEAAWVEMCAAVGFVNAAGQDADELWQAAMGRDPGVKVENVFFACDPAGRPVATATSRIIPEGAHRHYPPSDNGLGYLHYVAALPECRGRGAGWAVTAAVLRRFEELGLPDCVLTTDDHRLSAIRIYLAMGWLPVLNGPDMRARWQAVLAGLSMAEVTALDETGAETAPVRVTMQ